MAPRERTESQGRGAEVGFEPFVFADDLDADVDDLADAAANLGAEGVEGREVLRRVLPDRVARDGAAPAVEHEFEDLHGAQGHAHGAVRGAAGNHDLDASEGRVVARVLQGDALVDEGGDDGVVAVEAWATHAASHDACDGAQERLG